MFCLRHRSVKVTLFSKIHIKIISKISLTYHQIALCTFCSFVILFPHEISPFFPRNIRVGKCQKGALVFGKMPNLRFLAKRQKRESSKALILGHPQKRILPKIKSPYIRATLFILKRQNPLSSLIFSFKAS